jgi:hypothetical protein
MVGPSSSEVEFERLLPGKERTVRHLRKVLLGLTLIIFISPSECVFNYCLRHSFEPPICVD